MTGCPREEGQDPELGSGAVPGPRDRPWLPAPPGFLARGAASLRRSLSTACKWMERNEPHRGHNTPPSRRPCAGKAAGSRAQSPGSGRRTRRLGQEGARAPHPARAPPPAPLQPRRAGRPALPGPQPSATPGEASRRPAAKRSNLGAEGGAPAAPEASLHRARPAASPPPGAAPAPPWPPGPRGHTPSPAPRPGPELRAPLPRPRQPAAAPLSAGQSAASVTK